MIARRLPNRQQRVNCRFCLSGAGAHLPNRQDRYVSKLNRIREWREARRITLEELSERSGISVSYLSRMESGHRNVSLKNLAKIAEALQVPERDLVPADQAERDQRFEEFKQLWWQLYDDDRDTVLDVTRKLADRAAVRKQE